MKDILIGLAGLILLVGVTDTYSSFISTKSALASEVELPISLGDIGPRLLEYGVIDKDKFESKYLAEQKGMLKMHDGNTKEILNILWGFGLANKNEILEKGPMMNAEYGGAGNFASTGGWTLGSGDAMDHYSHHRMIELSPEQQKAVDDVSKKIFRPCCSNPAYFPDCNHGMAMLGLLEIMAHNNISPSEMESYAHRVNSLWFPQVQNSSCAA